MAAAAVALGGCANLVVAGARYDASELSSNPTLLVATTRKPANGARAKPWFGSERGPMSLARLKLTAPDESRFSLASIGIERWGIDAVEQATQVDELFAAAAGRRDMLIYVHGYNTTFETAALDAARLSDGTVAREAARLRL